MDAALKVSAAGQYVRMIILACGYGFVQQRPDLLGGGLPRPPGFALCVPHLVHRCGEQILFQGVQQRR